MTANELRVGNWVIYQNIHFCQVSDVLSEKHYFEGFSPVILNSYDLIDFGFESGIDPLDKDDSFAYYLDGIKILTRKRNSDKFMFSINNFNLEVRYIHELQNLVFALLKKELDLKL